jgi:cytochrome c553
MQNNSLAALILALSLNPYLTAADLPDWAYGIQTPSTKPAAPKSDPDALLHLPGNNLAFTRAQISSRFAPSDWYPGDHPVMPAIVANGQKPDVWACALCHYPNGKGRPENASVAGYPRQYFIQQMHEFRDGNRLSSDPNKANTKYMMAYAKAMTDQQIEEAADYFSAMKWTPWIKVVETATVPKMYASGGMFFAWPGGEKEPIGNRIIETPINGEATEVLRDPHSGFIAYAPKGSIEKGKKLVTEETGKTVKCGVCHGADLKGMGPVPGIAGRSPSYIVRQLFDMQQGKRKGLWTALMMPVVSKLTNEDMLNIAAYAASREP